jgi:acyl-CoA thioesterase-1
VSLPFQAGDLILFTGDSITDCGRNRNDPTSLGAGYVQLIAKQLEAEATELKLKFRNTGISGDRSVDLLERWDRDCIDLQPDWVSILLGVNNTWRRYDMNNPTLTETFEQQCRTLLNRVKEETAARIILCSPFLLHVDESVSTMREDLDPKIAVLKALSVEHDAIWVDFDAAFITAQQRHIPSYWAEDGVHPTAVGHTLLAETWVHTVKG